MNEQEQGILDAYNWADSVSERLLDDIVNAETMVRQLYLEQEHANNYVRLARAEWLQLHKCDCVLLAKKVGCTECMRNNYC